MSNENKNIIVPQLRFPEFLSGKDWDTVLLGQVLKSESSTLAQNNLSLIEEGYPVYGASGFIGYTSEFIQADDYIAIIKDGSGVGKLFLYNKQSSVLGTMNYLKSQNPKQYSLLYLYYLLQTISLSNYIKGSGIPHIYYSDYSKEIVTLPSPPEQQKIASCLSCLDELITTESKKLEALQDHKKGLMQKLFPAEGETVPKLRFAEFKDSGKWEEKTVNELVGKDVLFAPKDGNHGNIHPKSSDYVLVGVPFVMASDLQNGKIDFTKCARLRKEQADSLQKGFAIQSDVLLSHKGTVGEVVFLEKLEFPYVMLTPQVTYYRVKDNSKLSNKFLATFFSSDFFQANLKVASGGGTRAYIGIIEQGKLKLQIPTNISEQQKIADCIFSLDALITLLVEKLEILKQHKKGLMQGLFPNLNEMSK